MNDWLIPIDDLHEWLIVLMGTVIQIIHVSIAAGYISKNMFLQWIMTVIYIDLFHIQTCNSNIAVIVVYIIVYIIVFDDGSHNAFYTQ